MEVTASFFLHLPAKSKLKVKKGDLVNTGDLVALIDGEVKIKSPFKGKITTASKEKITISFSALEIKGKWGVGGQKIGSLVCLEKEEADLFDLNAELQDKLLVLFGCFNRGFWYKAASLGLAGIAALDLAEGFANEGLETFQEETDLPLIVWQDKDVFQPLWQIFKKNEGKEILIEGGEKRILIPL